MTQTATTGDPRTAWERWWDAHDVHLGPTVLFGMAALAAFEGYGVRVAAEGALHQLVGLGYWTIAAILLTGSMVLDAIHDSTKERRQDGDEE